MRELQLSISQGGEVVLVQVKRQPVREKGDLFRRAAKINKMSFLKTITFVENKNIFIPFYSCYKIAIKIYI